jgi:hypothetical protein
MNLLFNYGDIHVMGMKRNPGETIQVASLYNFFHLNNFENSSNVSFFYRKI